MRIELIPVGKSPPDDLNVVIEVPIGGEPVKYEFDIPGCVIRARPIAVLNLEDEAGGDEKLVCVPVDSTFPYYSNVGEKADLPEIVFEQIEHFFTHYKDLEKTKWVRVGTWGGRDEARRVTMEAIKRYIDAKEAGEEAPGMDKAEGEREGGA